MQRTNATRGVRLDVSAIVTDFVAIVGIILLMGGLAWVHPGLAVAFVGSAIVTGLLRRSS